MSDILNRIERGELIACVFSPPVSLGTADPDATAEILRLARLGAEALKHSGGFCHSNSYNGRGSCKTCYGKDFCRIRQEVQHAKSSD